MQAPGAFRQLYACSVQSCSGVYCHLICMAGASIVVASV
jgi:hypothetical protein